MLSGDEDSDNLATGTRIRALLLGTNRVATWTPLDVGLRARPHLPLWGRLINNSRSMM